MSACRTDLKACAAIIAILGCGCLQQYCTASRCGYTCYVKFVNRHYEGTCGANTGTIEAGRAIVPAPALLRVPSVPRYFTSTIAGHRHFRGDHYRTFRTGGQRLCGQGLPNTVSSLRLPAYTAVAKRWRCNDGRHRLQHHPPQQIPQALRQPQAARQFGS